jgi:hypothetical protein
MRVGKPIPTAGLTAQHTDQVSAQVKSAIEALHSAPKSSKQQKSPRRSEGL